MPREQLGTVVYDTSVLMRDSRKKAQIANELTPVIIHLNRLDGIDLSHGSPSNPTRRNKWKKDIEGFLNKIRERMSKMKKKMPLEQIMSEEKGWSRQQYEEFTKRLVEHGINTNGP